MPHLCNLQNISNPLHFSSDEAHTLVFKYSLTSFPVTPPFIFFHASGIIGTLSTHLPSFLGPSTAAILSGLLVRRLISESSRSFRIAVASPYERASAGCRSIRFA